MLDLVQTLFVPTGRAVLRSLSSRGPEKAPFIDKAKVGTVVQIDFVFNKRKAAATAAGRRAAGSRTASRTSQR